MTLFLLCVSMLETAIPLDYPHWLKKVTTNVTFQLPIVNKGIFLPLKIFETNSVKILNTELTQVKKQVCCKFLKTQLVNSHSQVSEITGGPAPISS